MAPVLQEASYVRDGFGAALEVSGELVLGILANAIYSALSKRKTHTEVSLYEHTSKREIEIVDTASGLRLKIRQVDKEAARHTID